MPNMNEYQSRYYMIIMPFIAILGISYIGRIMDIIKIRKIYKTIVIIMLVFINSMFCNYNFKSVYTFTQTKEEVEYINKIKDKDIFLNAKDICGTTIYSIRLKHTNIINRPLVGWIHSLSNTLMGANKIFISEGICNEETIEQIKLTNNPIIITPMTWGSTNIDDENIDCLEELGFIKKYKICASTFCNYLYEKITLENYTSEIGAQKFNKLIEEIKSEETDKKED